MDETYKINVVAAKLAAIFDAEDRGFYLDGDRLARGLDPVVSTEEDDDCE